MSNRLWMLRKAEHLLLDRVCFLIGVLTIPMPESFTRMIPHRPVTACELSPCAVRKQLINKNHTHSNTLAVKKKRALTMARSEISHQFCQVT